MTELPENVTAALAPETFDVLEFISGGSTPVDDVTIYTANEAGYRLAQLAQMEALNADRAESEGLGIADELEWVDPDEVAELREKVEQTALKFKLKGLAPAAKKAIRNHLVAKHNFKEGSDVEDNEAYFEEYSYTLIAKTIAGVTRGDGAIDTNEWTPERVESLRASINEGEFQRLDAAVYSINFNTDIFDRAASADFLSKR